MKRDTSSPKTTLDVLLDRGRTIAPISDSVRARALSRARSAMAMPAAERPGVAPVVRRRGLTIALAASVAFLAGASAAAIAFRGRAQPLTPPSSLAKPAACAVPAAQLPTASMGAEPSVVPPPSVDPKPQRDERAISAREYYAAELGLLQRAQAAYQDRNFATTLLIVAEHRRRFPQGRLAEEREALYVKALLGAGRDNEARHAASAFATRFPRSALLRRLSAEPNSGN